jgi:UDP-N-acetylmuramoyl-tripeptide--D-alanyl-D-alanine ligase
MEYFHDLDAVAAEELSVSRYAKRLLLNHDAIDPNYHQGIPHVSYGANGDYELTSKSRGLKGQQVTIQLTGGRSLSAMVPVLGKQGGAIVLAAAAVADAAGLDIEAIRQGLKTLPPTAGRMQVLAGIKQSTIIDDTYNASPVAATAALDVLYAQKAPQRIAILGSMNELGGTSKESHRQVGAYCDPKKLDYVITIGYEAKKYLAPAAKQAGCTVKSFLNPHEAGAFAKKQLKSKAVVLAKGSQNGVFAEEAVKPVLTDQTDEARLVRQSAYWLKIKRSQFGD